MKKYVIALVLAISIICINTVPAHATILDLGDGYAWVSNPTGVLDVGWDALSEICATANRDLKAGYFGVISTGSSCRIVWGSVGGNTGWFISLVNANGNYTNQYLGNVGNSRVFFSAYATYDQLNGIRGVLNNIYSAVDDLETTLGQINTKLGSIVANVSSLDLNVSTIYTRLLTIDSRILSIDTTLNAMASTLSGIKNDTNYLSGMSTQLQTIGNNIANYGADIITGQNSLYNLTLSQAQIITRIANTADAILGKMPNKLALDTVSSYDLPVINIPYQVMVDMVSNINNNYIGTEFKIYDRNNPGSYDVYILDYANMEHRQGNTQYYYLKITGHNGTNYVTGWYGVNTGNNVWRLFQASYTNTGTWDDTNIVNAINRIYDWLDNADLTTNTTIQQVITQTQTDVNNANDLYDKVESLFKKAYGDLDDNTTVADWTGVVSYFDNLWSDPQP